MPRHICLSCQSANLYESRAFGALPRVTSDCVAFPAGGTLCICLQCGLLQRIVNDAWKKEIEDIYRGYAVYPLTDGADQVLFSEGGVTRAEKVLDILAPELPADFSGSVIDVGCSNGSFLSAFGKRFPRAALYGKEIDDKNRQLLEQIPNFKRLFTAGDRDIGQAFDVVVSIHCFEHLYDYGAFFDEIAAITTPYSKILLQVPDVDTSPFDIAVADHAAHFSQATLRSCLTRHWRQVAVTTPIPKELTAVATPLPAADMPAPVPVRKDYTQALDRHVGYLSGLLEFIDRQRLDAFGVYGTRIASAWLTGAYQDKISFYVDDDTLKQGKKFYDKPILAPHQAPEESKVILPFAMPTIRQILKHHPQLSASAIYYE